MEYWNCDDRGYVSRLRLCCCLWCGQDHLTENEVIYIATDETDLSMFDVFKDRTRVRFLSDYYDRAGVSELNPNLLGMLEQVHHRK